MLVVVQGTLLDPRALARWSASQGWPGGCGRRA
jgi:hypothetical protein